MFPIPDHDLGLNDVQRSDRHNWRSAQKLTFPQVRNCLQMLMEGLVEGQPRNPSLLGSKIYLRVAWLYVEIFCSSIASLRRRITYAEIVNHFLAIWHDCIHRSEGLSLKQNLSQGKHTRTLWFHASSLSFSSATWETTFPSKNVFLTKVVRTFWRIFGAKTGNGLETTTTIALVISAEMPLTWFN